MAIALGVPATFGIGKFLFEFAQNYAATHPRLNDPWDQSC
jgi:hypothetical protein